MTYFHAPFTFPEQIYQIYITHNPQPYHTPNAHHQVCETTLSEQPQLKESFLQALWNEQVFSHDIITLHGDRVEIVKNGRWNKEAGPDFLDALITFHKPNGETTTIQGDIEIHLKPDGWYAHGHHKNPAYDKVALHVVWSAPTHKPIEPHIPTVEMKHFAGPTADEILNNLELQYYTPAQQTGPSVYAPLLSVKSDPEIQRILTAAGAYRFDAKVRRFQEKIVARGPEQTLYAGLADALGYKYNRKAFAQLTQKAHIQKLQKHPTLIEIKSILFGTAGLLPDPTTDTVIPELSHEINALWKVWWSHRNDTQNPPKWDNRGRPANSPERRLTALCLILAKHHCKPAEVLKQTTISTDYKMMTAILMDFLNAEDPQWKKLKNYTTQMKTNYSLLGENRRLEITVNILLPMLGALHKEAGTHIGTTYRLFQQLYLQIPKLQNNSLIKEGLHRLVMPPGRHNQIIQNNGCQQGVIQLVNDLFRHGESTQAGLQFITKLLE